MTAIKEEVFTNTGDIMPGLRKALPGAGAYMLEAIYCESGFEDSSALEAAVDKLKKNLGIEAQPLDDLLASILLRRQSIKAAGRKVEVCNARRALLDICSALALGDDYKNLLLDYYGALASHTLFTPQTEDKAAFAKQIDNLIETARELDKNNPHAVKDNADFIESLFKDKKIPPSIYIDLLNAYARRGAADFAAAFEGLLKDLNKINDNPAQNAILACRALLFTITAEEAAFAAQIAKAVKYPLEDDDLQTIALRYSGQKNPSETAEVFEAVLKRLPYLDDPLENLGLAARVMADSRPQTLQDAELTAYRRKDKVLFMRRLAADKFFAGYEDELADKFFGQNSAEEVSSMFHHILKELPYDKNIYENADTAVKVLLKKLPLKDGINQAQFKKENKKTAVVAIQRVVTPGGDGYVSRALEQEAFESYLGTKRKEEVFSFFNLRLAGFNFWKENEEKHCYALSVLVGQLNGKLSPAMADLALFLLDEGYPEESIDIITSGFAAAGQVEKQAVISAYEKFYAAGRDHADAARRTVNMLQ